MEKHGEVLSFPALQENTLAQEIESRLYSQRQNLIGKILGLRVLTPENQERAERAKKSPVYIIRHAEIYEDHIYDGAEMQIDSIFQQICYENPNLRSVKLVHSDIPRAQTTATMLAEKFDNRGVKHTAKKDRVLSIEYPIYPSLSDIVDLAYGKEIDDVYDASVMVTHEPVLRQMLREYFDLQNRKITYCGGLVLSVSEGNRHF